MKIYVYCLPLLSLLFSFAYGLNRDTDAITYEKWAGRTGDQLKLYVRTKIISEIYHIPLLYRPAKNFNQLMISIKEKCFSDNLKFDNTVYLGKDTNIKSEIEKTRKGSTLYIARFLKKDDDFWKFCKDKKMVAIFRNFIKPIAPIKEVFRPPNCITIAVHARKGGGFDNIFSHDEIGAALFSYKYFKKEIPLIMQANFDKQTLYNKHQNRFTQIYSNLYSPEKFPPDLFFIEQIKTIAHIFPGSPLYVYLFTDDQYPEKMALKYKQFLSDLPNIVIAYQENNSSPVTVLDDLFSMAKFDCLIRAESSISFIAQMIGDHKIIFSPKTIEFFWNDYNKEIDEYPYRVTDVNIVEKL